MLRTLSELEARGQCRHTIYLNPQSLRQSQASLSKALETHIRESSPTTEHYDVVRQVGESDTGVVLFWWDDRALAVVPPFPVEKETYSQRANTAPLVELLSRELLVGVVLLRLGRYAVGVFQGDRLVTSKSDSRYVKRRHRAGGSSQRRFERSRERLIRELFDKACQVTRDVFSPFENRIDYILMGGERHTLQGFTRRCTFLHRFGCVTLRRVLEVDQPGQKALEQIPYEVWKSRVLVFALDSPDISLR